MTNFRDFLVQHGIVTTAASITIGFATAAFIKSFIADLLMPLIFMVVVGGLNKVSKESGSFIGKFLASKDLKFTNFVSELITWLLIIIVAFVILDALVLKYMNKKPVHPVAGNALFFQPPPPVVQDSRSPALPLPPAVPVPAVPTASTGVKEGYSPEYMPW